MDIVVTELKKEHIKLDFKCYEYIGPEVLKGGSCPKESDIILTYDGLSAGDEVFIPWMVGFMKMKVNEEKTHAYSQDSIAYLEFDKDERHCWVAACFGNRKAIERLEVN